MRLYNITYFLREGISSIFSHRLMSFAAMSVITACLLLMGSFSLVAVNIDKVLEVADRITELCAEPINFEAILQKLFAEYSLTMTFEQYVLIGSTVRSYLAWLKDSGRIAVRFENNMMLWERV